MAHVALFLLVEMGSLGMWAPPLLGGPSSLRYRHRNSTGEEGAWLALVLPAASGLGHHHTSWVLYSWTMPPLLRWFCTSTRPNPPTARGTDVWLSRVSSCAVQRILCWAISVPVTDCGLTGGSKGKDSGCHTDDSAFPVRGRASTKGC